MGNVSTVRPWVAESIKLDESGPEVVITYRLPTAAELMKRREAAAGIGDRSLAPKPGEVAAGAANRTGTLIEAVKLNNLLFETAVPLVIKLEIDGMTRVEDPAEARAAVMEDARFVPHVVLHSRHLFRDGAGRSAERPVGSGSSPEVSPQPGDGGGAAESGG